MERGTVGVPVIPAEAVEAAAKEIDAPSEPAAQEIARAALEAAAPYIRAQALEDAADIADRPENKWWAEGMQRAKWLRSLAAAERGGE